MFQMDGKLFLRYLSEWMREEPRETNLERRICLALPEEITTCHDASINILRKIEVNDPKTWVARCIWISGNNSLREWVGLRLRREERVVDVPA